jgi:23S rRNA G2445 N2-methylase RlmL
MLGLAPVTLVTNVTVEAGQGKCRKRHECHKREFQNPPIGLMQLTTTRKGVEVVWVARENHSTAFHQFLHQRQNLLDVRGRLCSIPSVGEAKRLASRMRFLLRVTHRTEDALLLSVLRGSHRQAVQPDATLPSRAYPPLCQTKQTLDVARRSVAPEIQQ